MDIEKIRSELTGYHVDIQLFPSGGMIDATGCKECGTDDKKFETVSWKEKKGQDIIFAVNKLKIKLGIKEDGKLNEKDN